MKRGTTSLSGIVNIRTISIVHVVIYDVKRILRHVKATFWIVLVDVRTQIIRLNNINSSSL